MSTDGMNVTTHRQPLTASLLLWRDMPEQCGSLTGIEVEVSEFDVYINA